MQCGPKTFPPQQNNNNKKKQKKQNKTAKPTEMWQNSLVVSKIVEFKTHFESNTYTSSFGNHSPNLQCNNKMAQLNNRIKEKLSKVDIWEFGWNW